MENEIVTRTVKFKDCFRNHDLSLQQIFNDVVKMGFEIFKEHNTLDNTAFIIMKDFSVNEYRIAVYPIIATNHKELAMHSEILRRMIKEIQEGTVKQMPDVKMVGVIRTGSGRMSMIKAEEVIKKDGTIDASKVIKPHDDPQAKDVLIFDLEEDFIKTTRMYEYLDMGDGVVVNEAPVMDNRRGYDVREDQNALFGFLFTRGQSAVN